MRSDGRSVRPPVAYTDNLKLEGIARYGYTDTNPADYEEDHVIPLELGGDGYSELNLWPEARYPPHPATEKDSAENSLHSLVCAGAVTLAAAQVAIAANWETALSSVERSTPTKAPTPPTQPASFTVTITQSIYGFLAATTVPGASCTARAKLPSGRISTAAGLQVTNTAGQDGSVSWSYGTSTTTRPGTGTHTVTCTLSGQTVSVSAPFTVS